MASSRDKNTQEHYILEETAYSKSRNITLFKNSPNGQAYQPLFAGDGLIHGRMGNSTLSSNYTDIENLLFGIGANNLVNPRPEIVPQINKLPSLDIIHKPAVIQIDWNKPTKDEERLRLMASSNIIPKRWEMQN